MGFTIPCPFPWRILRGVGVVHNAQDMLTHYAEGGLICGRTGGYTRESLSGCTLRAYSRNFTLKCDFFYNFSLMLLFLPISESDT